ncbi:MAG: PqqD family protein [Planctomycetota bacterium]|jgi:hypothetical protein
MNREPETYRAPRDLLLADFGEEGTLAFRLSVRAGKILNPTAALVFETLRSGAGPEEAAGKLAGAFGIGLERAREDVDTLVSNLAEEGLIRSGREPEGTPALPEDWRGLLEGTMEEPKEETAPEPGPPPDIPEDAVVARTEADVIFREEEEGAFLFEPETGELSCLNPVGIEVWKLVDGKKTFGAIVDAVTAEYEGVGRETVLGDVRAFLGELKNFGYVAW